MSDTTVDYPKSLMKDVMIKRECVKHDLEVNRAATIRDTLNDHYYPLVKCPWGCTEYHVKCSHVEFDILLQHLLGEDLDSSQVIALHAAGQAIAEEDPRFPLW